jgi:3-deoxy-manno-octulosonate cytidylyltransferase (CMP-KDO synthetase)
LLDIAGKPMIQHVWESAIASDLGRVVVATDSDEIAECIESLGGDVCMTSENHQTGTDRMYEALQVIDPGRAIHYIINLQGDLPTINSMALKKVVYLLYSEEDEIGTLVTQFKREEDLKKEQFVKAVCSLPSGETESYAENFVRKQGDYNFKNLFHHIGIYAFKRDALEKFVTLSQTDREKNEKLEQLRAIDNKMKIKIGLIDFLPLGVDTPEDLEKIRKILSE